MVIYYDLQYEFFLYYVFTFDPGKMTNTVSHLRTIVHVGVQKPGEVLI
jgi:hypothetical protein